ncbi:MAG: DNA-binding response regulator [Sarcina sp.]
MGSLAVKKYLKHIYDETTDGYIQVIQLGKDGNVKEKSNYKNTTLNEIIKKYIGLEDVYITPNTSFNGVRSVNTIRQLRSLYIDIDIDLEAYSKNDVIALTYLLSDEGKLPKPSLILDSGNGLHYYWRIKNAPSQALGAWQTLEDYLYFQLKHFGADSRATDAARVLRLVETINSKNGKVCSTILVNNYTYSMYDLLDEYINKPYLKEKKKFKKTTKVITNKFFNSYSLHLARLDDIVKLCEIREFRVNGYRNFILHCYAYWTGVCLRDLNQLNENVREFNNRFSDPLPSSQVEAILRCIPKAINKFIEYEQGIILNKDKRISKGMRDKGGYWYKNSTLIERLDITIDEQKSMKTIIGTSIKYERKNIIRRETRRNKNGLTKREQQKQDTINSVKSLKEQGLNNTQIAKALNISRVYVSRIINS